MNIDPSLMMEDIAVPIIALLTLDLYRSENREIPESMLSVGAGAYAQLHARLRGGQWDQHVVCVAVVRHHLYKNVVRTDPETYNVLTRAVNAYSTRTRAQDNHVLWSFLDACTDANYTWFRDTACSEVYAVLRGLFYVQGRRARTLNLTALRRLARGDCLDDGSRVTSVTQSLIRRYLEDQQNKENKEKDMAANTTNTTTNTTPTAVDNAMTAARATLSTTEANVGLGLKAGAAMLASDALLKKTKELLGESYPKHPRADDVARILLPTMLLFGAHMVQALTDQKALATRVADVAGAAQLGVSVTIGRELIAELVPLLKTLVADVPLMNDAASDPKTNG